jgi:aspartate aminotransferase
MRKEYQARRDILYAGLKELGFDFPLPEGAFYIFAPMSPALLDRVLAAGLVIVPGTAFGSNAPDYARFSYAASRQVLQQAVDRICSVMEE